MASILSLPDEVLEIIGWHTEQHVSSKAWCMLMSSCKRLWTLQLPYSCHGCSLTNDDGFGTSIEGRSYMLKLVYEYLQNDSHAPGLPPRLSL